MGIDDIYSTFALLHKSAKNVNLKSIPKIIAKYEETIKAAINEAINYKGKYEALANDPVVAYILAQRATNQHIIDKIDTLEDRIKKLEEK